MCINIIKLLIMNNNKFNKLLINEEQLIYKMNYAHYMFFIN